MRRFTSALRSRTGLAAAAAGLAVTAALAGAVTAEAAGSYISSNSGGANVRSCASTSCGSYGYLTNGTGVSMQCWLDSQWVYPPSSNYASNRWFRVSSPVGTGYVHSSLVGAQTSVPHC
ncbi:SH3 domain-containing protein [Streptomyces sp. NPDC089799]|uniref:SH3 domain-containing protein n=1 Tax=Streptomyces sp. NPDC089799 TaxID=3155066 RepID=UPI00342B5689